MCEKFKSKMEPVNITVNETLSLYYGYFNRNNACFSFGTLRGNSCYDDGAA